MPKHKFSYAEKYSVWDTHGYKCYWCGEPLEIQQVTVDHVIPEDLEEKEEKLQWVKEHYSLPKEFAVNSFYNWVPCHNNCNSKKSTTLFQASPAFIAVLHDIIKKGDIATNKHERLKSAQSKSKVIAKILVELENNNVSKEELLELLGETNEVQEIKEVSDKEIHIRVSDRWKVLKFESDSLALVSDGRMTGITPTVNDPHISWMCPTCGSYGPWNGVMCMSCGMKSDPYD